MTTCTKVKFARESNADEYIAQLKKTSKRAVVPVRSYLCEKCLTWHLTSRPMERIDSTSGLKFRLEEVKREVKETNRKLAKAKSDNIKDRKLAERRLRDVTFDRELMKVCITIIAMR